MTFTSTTLITGGTTGLGYEAALAIAKQNPHTQIIISSRSSGDEAAASINSKTGNDTAKWLRLDLSSLSNIRDFVNKFTEGNYPPITTLLLNAGLQFPSGVTYTADGLESTFGVNHVGHALLFHLLVPHLHPEARIVVTSSGTHDPAQKTGLPDAKYDTAEKLAHPDAESIRNNAGRQRYSTSKLVNILWTYALHQKQTTLNKHWKINAFDPGLMPGTGLARDAGPFIQFLWHRVLPKLLPLIRLMIPNVHTAQESGGALAWVATSDETKEESGKYFEGRKEIKSSVDSYVESKQQDLWQWTVDFVSQDNGEKGRFDQLE